MAQDTYAEVKLISKPENILKTVYTACRTCYSSESPLNIFDGAADNEKMLKLVRKVISSGHYSTIEHVQISFALNRVSRACTHQLVRHRHASFSQKSQRYVKEKGQFEYLTPDSIACSPLLKQKFDDLMQKTSEVYTALIDSGIPAEDARAVLPNAAASSMVVSMNLRELIHIANLRLCTRAQKEIRILVQRMCGELIKEEPWLKEYLAPKCELQGFCSEDKSCGRMPKKEELLCRK